VADRTRIPVALAACLACIAAPPVLAEGQSLRPRLELTPFIGGRLGGSFDSTDAEGNTIGIDIDEDASFGIIVNFPSTVPTEWEFVYSQQSTSLDRRSASDLRPLDLDIIYLHGGGLYLFEGDLARPYIAATLGATRFSPDDSEFQSETKFSFALGAGYKLFPEGRFGLRLDARVWGTLLESNGSLFCRSGPEAAGCQIRSSGTVLWQWELSAGGILRF